MSETTLREIEAALRRLGFHRDDRPRRRGLPRFMDVRYVGRLASKRRATVGFAGVSSATEVRLAVEADAAARFEVERRGALDWLASRLLGFEDTHIHAEQRERALLAREELRAAIDGVFAKQRARSLALVKGELTLRASFFFLRPAAYGDALDVLDAIARHFDRVKLRVRVLGGERHALSGAHGPRCAYCHDGLSGDEGDLVACECCATVLHASCWQENAGCPILGCDGVEPESAVGGGR